GGLFDTKNVGTNKDVTASVSKAGADAGNYSANTTAAAKAAITPASLVIGITAADKEYNGNRDAATTAAITSGLVAGDVVTVASTGGLFDTKNVGTNKDVTASVSKAGADAGNYSANTTAAAKAAITAKPLIGSFTVKNKIVDDNTSAVIETRSIDGVVGTENVSLSGGTATFATSSPGVNILVTGTGFTLTGSDISNYSLPVTTLTTKATIFNVATVSLSTPGPVPVSTTTVTNPSTIVATIGSDVFEPTWSYTIPSGNILAGSTTSSLSVKSTSAVVYGVSMTYKDGMGNPFTTPTVYIVFYDPNAGFVTGGGWIESKPLEESACASCKFMRAGGKANFGFTSKYEKGRTVPTGNTEFQFQAGGMNFKSSSYEWLVIASTRAQYKGVGTVNGFGNYGFLLTAIDGDLAPTKTTDKFRIKIWDIDNGGAVVYDNQYGSEDGAVPTTALGGGSIVIHEIKSGKTQSAQDVQVAVNPALTLASKLTISAYPNPAVSQFNIRLESNNTREAITLKVFNQLGQVVDVKRNLFSGQVVQVGAAYKQGAYFVEVTQGEQKQNLQLVKTN
ncbi:T9SS type A sorting domain-containing protein, partial [Flavisolibacter sp. BT320]|nr:T9SS type A sorting domain-containing protein [Flavisolibacter longurius]